MLMKLSMRLQFYEAWDSDIKNKILKTLKHWSCFVIIIIQLHILPLHPRLRSTVTKLWLTACGGWAPHQAGRLVVATRRSLLYSDIENWFST